MKIGQVTDESVKKCTGRAWDEWIKVLTKAGAREWPRKEIVQYLKSKHKLTPWWQQGVATGFEIGTGRKIEGQNARGLYSVSGTRTFAMSVAKTWALFSEHTDIWLKPMSPVSLKVGETFESEGGVFGEIRTLKKNGQIRFRWQEEDWERTSVVTFFLVSRDRDKCVVGFSQTDIPNTRVRETMREHWKTVLDEMQALMTSPERKRS